MGDDVTRTGGAPPEEGTGLWSGGEPRIVTLRRERDEANERIVEQLRAFAQIRNIVDQYIAVEGNHAPRPGGAAPQPPEPAC